MARKKVKNFYTKKEYYQFHAGYLSYLNLKQNKSFKEEVDKCLSSRFDSKTSTQMKKTLKQDNTRVIALIMFDKNRKSLIFQGVGCCCLFIHRKICLFWLFESSKIANFFPSHRVFEDTSFDDLSSIVIPELLLKIVSYYGFVQDYNSTLILTCRSKLVSYYPYKGFGVFDLDSQYLNNVSLRVKQCIHAVNMFEMII